MFGFKWTVVGMLRTSPQLSYELGKGLLALERMLVDLKMEPCTSIKEPGWFPSSYQHIVAEYGDDDGVSSTTDCVFPESLLRRRCRFHYPDMPEYTPDDDRERLIVGDRYIHPSYRLIEHPFPPEQGTELFEMEPFHGFVDEEEGQQLSTPAAYVFPELGHYEKWCVHRHPKPRNEPDDDVSSFNPVIRFTMFRCEDRLMFPHI